MRKIHCNVAAQSVPLLYVDNGGCYGGIFDSPNRVTFYLCDDDHPGWGSTIYFGNGSIRYITPTSPGDYEGPSLIPPPFPSEPTREQVLGVNIHFMGGIVVDSPIYGKMPWWPTALSWCDSVTRKLSYEAAHRVGDTHCIIEIPNGLPLYNEGSQFYSPDKFGPLDWTNNETTLDSRFSDLVDEVISNNFGYIIAMDERMEHSKRIVQLVMKALNDEQTKFGFVIPGYDAVFYGWNPSDITVWGRLARQIKPNCYLGIEHNPGHIPLGGGPDDYLPNGRMNDFDVVLGEFDSNIHQDSTWQVLGRMIRPYKRPPDQPSNDDPNPPFYLVDSPRGKRYYCAFETFNPYDWVRININDQNAVLAAQDEIERERMYFNKMGVRYTG